MNINLTLFAQALAFAGLIDAAFIISVAGGLLFAFASPFVAPFLAQLGG